MEEIHSLEHSPQESLRNHASRCSNALRGRGDDTGSNADYENDPPPQPVVSNYPWERPPYPWRFFTLPDEPTRYQSYDRPDEDGEIRLSSEKCEISQLRTFGIAHAPDKPIQVEEIRPIVEVEMHQKTERELPPISVHNCEHCSGLILDLRGRSGRQHEDILPVTNTESKIAVRDGCVLFKQIDEFHERYGPPRVPRHRPKLSISEGSVDKRRVPRKSKAFANYRPASDYSSSEDNFDIDRYGTLPFAFGERARVGTASEPHSSGSASSHWSVSQDSASEELSNDQRKAGPLAFEQTISERSVSEPHASESTSSHQSVSQDLASEELSNDQRKAGPLAFEKTIGERSVSEPPTPQRTPERWSDSESLTSEHMAYLRSILNESRSSEERSHDRCQIAYRLELWQEEVGQDESVFAPAMLKFHKPYMSGTSDWPSFELYPVLGKSLYTDLVDDSMPPNLVPASELSFSRAQQWLEQCDKTHLSCQEYCLGQMPKRVLDVSVSGSSTRLVDSPESARYCTLSYVWGGPQPAKLTRANRQQYEQEINDSEIPVTIRDAIIVARGIGVRYLWVDSLCIVQDDDEDKNVQITDMHRIYRGSAVTIVAASARSSTKSFLEPRSEYQPISLNVRWEDNVYGEVLAVPDSLHQGQYIHEIQEYHKLFTRGWTFQETLVSTRVLVYGKRGMMFCCLEMEEWDGGRSSRSCGIGRSLNPGMSRYVGLPSDQVPTRTTLRHPFTWLNLVSQYTQRDLSVESDKLLAVIAVAEEYARRMPVTEYFAGLWREDLLCQLLWRPTVDRKSFEANISKSDLYRAPSWSWASLDGAVERVVTGKDELDWTCQLLDVKVSLYDPRNRFGRVTGGHIELRGKMKKLEWIVGDAELYRGGHRIHEKVGGSDECPLEVHLDLRWPYRRETPLWAMGVSRGKRLMPNNKTFYDTGCGLVLEVVKHTSKTVYRRVGIVIVYEWFRKPYWFDTGFVQDIEIVII